jgi:hypothetical protein
MKRSRLVALGAFGALAALLALKAGAQTWGRESLALMEGGVAQRFAESTPLPGPLYTLEILAYALLAAACLFAAGKLLWAVGRGFGAVFSAIRHRRPLAFGESGQAMTEVAVSFPVLLITTLILMQLALMYQAKNVVTYAAFSAARAAIVWIPAEAEGEGKHQITIDGGEKWDKIHQAASMACIPISPRASVVLDGLPFIGDIIADAFSVFSSLLGSFGLAGEYTDNALQRYGYATFATEVKLYKATEAGFEEQSGTVTWGYPNGGDVAVRVRHRYYLPIPVVNRIIGDDWSIIDMGPFFSIDLPGEYTFIRSVAVMPLEGETGGPGDGWATPPIEGFWD